MKRSERDPARRARTAAPVQTSAAVAALALSAACGSTPTEPPDPVETTEITTLPRALTAAEESLISSSNAFGFDLFAELLRDEPDENLFMSPLSAHLALGMALNGARETTFEAMRTTLGFEAAADLASINAAYADLLELLDGLDPSVELDVANSVWYEPTFPFRSTYLETVGTTFDARVEALDFADPGSVDVINTWVEDATNGRITEMLDQIDAGEVMFLLNAIYFKGDWRTRFDAELTRDAPFRLTDGSTKNVKMMTREEGDFLTSHNATFDLIDLPYGGTPFRMTILLPAEGVSLASRLEGLDAATWASWISGLASSTAPFQMPRFRLEWEKQLRDALEALGMEIAFQPGQANFGGMLDEGFDPSAPGTDLHITRVKQKSFVDVNEVGTEAAAATSVGIGVTSAPLPIVVDRPFAFAIRERLSGTILFLGAVLDPPGE